MPSLFSRLVSRLGPSSATTSAGSTESSNTTEASWQGSTLSGPTLLLSGPETCFPSIASLPQTRQLVVRQGLKTLFEGSFFDICKVREICEVLHVDRDTEAYRLLQTLHCVKYTKMLPELRNALPQLVKEALNPPPVRCEAAEEALKGMNFN